MRILLLQEDKCAISLVACIAEHQSIAKHITMESCAVHVAECNEMVLYTKMVLRS